MMYLTMIVVSLIIADVALIVLACKRNEVSEKLAKEFLKDLDVRSN